MRSFYGCFETLQSFVGLEKKGKCFGNVTRTEHDDEHWLLVDRKGARRHIAFPKSFWRRWRAKGHPSS